MVSAIPDEWQWPGMVDAQTAFMGSAPKLATRCIQSLPQDYRLRMIVQDMVAEHGANRVAIMLADIAKELL